MKLSLFVVAGLLAPSLDAFTVPAHHGNTAFKPTTTSLGFVPKDVTTTEKVSSPFADVNLNAATLTDLDLAKSEEKSTWEKFARWITSTENRLYIGWFGTLMFPTLLAATACFITAFIAAPPGKCDMSSCQVMLL